MMKLTLTFTEEQFYLCYKSIIALSNDTNLFTPTILTHLTTDLGLLRINDNCIYTKGRINGTE